MIVHSGHSSEESLGTRARAVFNKDLSKRRQKARVSGFKMLMSRMRQRG